MDVPWPSHRRLANRHGEAFYISAYQLRPESLVVEATLSLRLTVWEMHWHCSLFGTASRDLTISIGPSLKIVDGRYLMSCVSDTYR